MYCKQSPGLGFEPVTTAAAVSSFVGSASSIADKVKGLFGARGMPGPRDDAATVQRVIGAATAGERAELGRLWNAVNHRYPWASYQTNFSFIARALTGGSDGMVTTESGKRLVAYYLALRQKYLGIPAPGNFGAESAGVAERVVGGVRDVVRAGVEAARDQAVQEVAEQPEVQQAAIAAAKRRAQRASSTWGPAMLAVGVLALLASRRR